MSQSVVDALLAEYRVMQDEKHMHQRTVTQIAGGMATGIIAVIAASGAVGNLLPAMALPTILTLTALFSVLAHLNVRRLAVYLSLLEEEIDRVVGTPGRTLGWETFIGSWSDTRSQAPVAFAEIQRYGGLLLAVVAIALPVSLALGVAGLVDLLSSSFTLDPSLMANVELELVVESALILFYVAVHVGIAAYTWLLWRRGPSMLSELYRDIKEWRAAPPAGEHPLESDDAGSER